MPAQIYECFALALSHLPLINDKPLEANPYLKARSESQLHAKHAFERRAGWRFGLVFGAMIVLVGYLFDAIERAQLHTEFWWIHLALAILTILPLATLAGAISGYVNWWLKMFVWAGFGIAAGWCAIHIPFDLARAALQFFDPDLRAVEYILLPRGAENSFGMLATMGALLGVLVGLTQTFTVNWAWERSTREYQLTLGGWAMFLIALPFAIGYGLLFDGSAQQPLRAPMASVSAIIQSGLNDPPELDTKNMEMHRALTYLVGQRWRASFAPQYTLHLAASEPQVKGETYVDASFANGSILRCRITTFGEFSGGCVDMTQLYANYISEFLRRGVFECQDCQAQVSAQAAAWQQENARTLTENDVTTVTHGAGSSVRVRVVTTDGNSIECLFWGANPVVIQACQ